MVQVKGPRHKIFSESHSAIGCQHWTAFHLTLTFNSRTVKIHGKNLIKIQLIVFFTHFLTAFWATFDGSRQRSGRTTFDTCGGAPSKQDSTRAWFYLWKLTTTPSLSLTIYHSVPNLLLPSGWWFNPGGRRLSHSFDQTPQFSTQVLPRSKDNGVQQNTKYRKTLQTNRCRKHGKQTMSNYGQLIGEDIRRKLADGCGWA
jgi:hypothetical protein